MARRWGQCPAYALMTACTERLRLLQKGSFPWETRSDACSHHTCLMAISPCLRGLWHITASPSRDRAHLFACTAHCAVCAACRWAHGACSSCNLMFPKLLMLAGQHQLDGEPVNLCHVWHLKQLTWQRSADFDVLSGRQQRSCLHAP